MESKFNTIGIFNCAISEITLAELIYGAEHSSNIEKNLQFVESFTSNIAVIPIIDCIYLYGKEKSRLRKAGKMISDFDLLIGTTAVSLGMIMVTENVSEFERIAGIQIENWITR